MPSEHRLHPASMLFALARTLRMFAVPGLLLLFAGRSSGGMDGRFGRMPPNWELWFMLLVIPSLLSALVRFLTFRISYEGSELVIRSGFIFRNERHLPYSRIQNLDAVQNVVHRLLGVTEVRVETGAGKEPDATFSVLPVATFEEMRRRVFEGRDAARAGASPREAGDAQDAEGVAVTGTLAANSAPDTPVTRTAMPRAISHPEAEGVPLLTLPLRELLLHGFLENRGMVLIAGLAGVLSELGVFDRLAAAIFGDTVSSRGMMRDAIRRLAEGSDASLDSLALVLAAFGGLLLIVRVMSMVWAAVRLHGFTLTLVGEDLRTRFGLLTRVTATIPLRRVQTMTLHSGLLERLAHRASARVETAGGVGAGPGAAPGAGRREREWLAPIIRSGALPDLVRRVVPGVDLRGVSWQPVDPRAFRRAVKPYLFVAVMTPLAAVGAVGWWALAALAVTVPWAILAARGYVRHLGWATTDEAVLFRSGWVWRRVTIAPIAKIQAVTRAESPFDRRLAMARVRIDTAGAGDRSHRVDIPYLPRDTAVELHGQLASRAAETVFRW